MGKRPKTYQEAGVSIPLARRFIRMIEPLARLTRRQGLVRGIGGFGGLFELSAAGSRGLILAASADGVGTKLCLAREIGWMEALGVDLVAMNVNDILCTGAKPLFFLDYVAVGRLDPKVLVGIVRGIVRGCLESRCVLLGGETAQMPLVYKPKGFDLAGFAVGMVTRDKLITGAGVRWGDAVLGLESSGPHANGFTLIQKVLTRSQLKKYGRALLSPTRIYVRPVLDLLGRQAPLRGIAHITGGSFGEKIPRVLPEGHRVVLRKGSWRVPPIFQRLQAAGISEAQMYRTFNMGIGMALILPKAQVIKVQSVLRKYEVGSWVIGEVTRGDPGVEIQ